MAVLKEPLQFQWNKGNNNKNWKKHSVKNQEAEEAFFDKNKQIFKDKLHSEDEERFRIIGKTKKGRLLFVAFTIRGERIKIISARDINKKEVYLYEEKA